MLHARFNCRFYRILMLLHPPAWHIQSVGADQQQTFGSGKSLRKRLRLIKIRLAYNHPTVSKTR
ncbi:hypothetical protein D3C76_1795400 [compost metagenome]